jgi:hypothetical protein
VHEEKMESEYLKGKNHLGHLSEKINLKEIGCDCVDWIPLVQVGSSDWFL